MKKILCFLLAVIILLSLCACSTVSEDQKLLSKYKNLISLLEDGEYETAIVLIRSMSPVQITEATSVPDTVETTEAKEPENEEKLIKLDNPIVILDNQYIRMEVIEVFQENVNWAGKNTPSLEKGLTIKTTNKTDYDFLVDLDDLFIGDNQVKDIMMDGSISPVAHKSEFNSFRIQNHLGREDTPLDSIDDIFRLGGKIEVNKYIASNQITEIGIYEFSLS